MSSKTQGIISILAAVAVLFFAMLDPVISIGIAVVALLGMGVWLIVDSRLARDEYAKRTYTPLSGVTTSLIEKQAEEKRRNKEAILGILETQSPLTNNHVEQLLGISDATAERYLQELENEGKVRQVGKTGKYVFYELI